MHQAAPRILLGQLRHGFVRWTRGSLVKFAFQRIDPLGYPSHPQAMVINLIKSLITHQPAWGTTIDTSDPEPQCFAFFYSRGFALKIHLQGLLVLGSRSTFSEPFSVSLHFVGTAILHTQKKNKALRARPHCRKKNKVSKAMQGVTCGHSL